MTKMLTAVSGYYNGTEIVMDEQVRMNVGQRLIITLLSEQPQEPKNVTLKQYRGRGEKMFTADAGKYVEDLRSNDRV